MTRAIRDETLSELSGLLAASMGLDYPPERWGDLERAVRASAGELGARSPEACARELLSTPLTRQRLDVLAGHLTIGETYFFRDPATFAALEQHVIPAWLGGRAGQERRLRIWSAGCCTGEEPYSIAILLDRLLPQAERWNLTILGTDINPAFLRRAAAAVYGEWSFRGTPDWVRERYFRKTKDRRYALVDAIRRRVTLSYLNLAVDPYPALTTNTTALDLILCRNVLMYFGSDAAARAAANFHRALVDGGWLIVSPVEGSSRLLSAFGARNFAGATFYQRADAHERRHAASPASAPVVVPAPPPTRARATHARPVALPAPTAAAPERQTLADEAARNARRSADAGRLAEAAEWCEKSIALDKLNPARHYLMATIRRELNQGAEAAQALQRALYLDPDFVLAHFALGTLRLSQGRTRDAQQHLDNAQALLRDAVPGAAVPEADGLTAGRLAEIIATIRASAPGLRPAAAHAA